MSVLFSTCLADRPSADDVSAMGAARLTRELERLTSIMSLLAERLTRRFIKAEINPTRAVDYTTQLNTSLPLRSCVLVHQ